MKKKKGEKIKIICAYCGNKAKVYQDKRNKGKRFCNIICYKKYQKKYPLRYWLNKKRSPETIEKMRKGMLGKKHTLKWKEMMRLKMKDRFFSKEHRRKISEAKMGEKNGMWKGGITKFLRRVRGLKEYKEWKVEIFKKTGITLKEAKEKSLQVHHLKPINQILEENQIDTIKKAEQCAELWDVENGVVLPKWMHFVITKIQKMKASKENLEYLKNIIKIAQLEIWRMESKLKN